MACSPPSHRSAQEAAAAQLQRLGRQATTPRVLEAALQLQQRLQGAALEREPLPALAKRLAHQFPQGSLIAYPLLGALLYARLLAGGPEPSTAPQRAHILQAGTLSILNPALYHTALQRLPASMQASLSTSFCALQP